MRFADGKYGRTFVDNNGRSLELLPLTQSNCPQIELMLIYAAAPFRTFSGEVSP